MSGEAGSSIDATAPDAAAPDVPTPGGQWRGYPKGALLIIGVEFWERFSFYGMLSILALFLTAARKSGGFGWPATQALALVGGYSGAMYAFPAFGGYLADRVLGRRRAVTVGASLMLVGQVLLAAAAAVAAAVSVDAQRGAAGAAHDDVAASVAFYAALACLICGNALMKSTLVVLCGETMRADDPRREAAYAYYYLGISVGAMLSGLAVGSAAETFGWHVGFGIAAVGMAFALAAYVILAPRWLGQIGIRPDGPRRDAAGNRATSGDRARRSALETRRRIFLLLALAILLCCFSIGWFQLFGSWLLFIERHVDRTVGSFTIPVPWFTSMNAAVVIGLAPFVAALWVRLGRRNQRIDIVQKYAFALATVAVGHGLMYLGARQATAAVPAPVWIPLASLSLLAVGELVAWTATYGMVSRAAPEGFASVAMGAWYLMTLGLGGYLSGFAGGLVDRFGFAATFALVTAAMAVACLAAGIGRGAMARLAARAGVSL